MDILFGVCLILTFLGGALAGDYCLVDLEYKYCTYGCCGDYPRESCCSFYVWAVVLAVLGSIFFISCAVCVACCWYKKKERQGQVMATPHTGVTSTTVTYVNNGYQPYMGYGQPPPMYQATPGYQPQPQPVSHPGYGQSTSCVPLQAPGYQPMADSTYLPPPPKYEY